MSRKIFIPLLILILAALSCNLPGQATPTLPPPPTLTPKWAAAPESPAQMSPTPRRATAYPTFTPAAPPAASPAPTTAPETGGTATSAPAGEALTLTYIHMVTRATGWGIGHTASSGARILVTADGGQTWEDRTPPDSLASDPAEAESAWGYFADENTALALYAPQSGPSPTEAPVIWHTADGGNTWQASAPLPTTGNEDWFTPEAFAFVDEQTGWLLVHVGAGMSHDYSELFATTNGGTAWIRIADPHGSGLQSLHNTGIAFADPQFGWVTKDNLGVMPGAFLEQTTDGGAAWEDIFLPPPPDFNWTSNLSQCAVQSPVFPAPQTGLVIVNCRTSDENPPRTWVYRTINRGADWTWQELPTSASSLLFLGSDNGWAFGRDLYRTSDGGRSWTQFKTVTWDGQFSFVDALYGWAVARKDVRIALVNTADGGKTWQIIEPILVP